MCACVLSTCMRGYPWRPEVLGPLELELKAVFESPDMGARN